jgi:hypothetical protein
VQPAIAYRELSSDFKDPFEGAPLGDEMRRIKEQMTSNPDLMTNMMKSPEMKVRYSHISPLFAKVHLPRVHPITFPHPIMIRR